VIVPAGWTVISATGGGFSSFDIYFEPGGPEEGWAFEVPYYALSPNGTPSQNPTAFSFKVVVPAGQSGSYQMTAKATYYFEGMSALEHTLATPNPLILNQETKTLQVVSPYGTGTPAAGVYTNLAGTVLSLSMTPTGSSGPTQYVCTGWSMTGQEPASGVGTSFEMTVAADAVLTWNWQQSNIAPGISGPYVLNAWRTSIQGANANNTISEAVLTGMASDPDGDTLSLASIATQGSKGGSLTRDAANHTLTYIPPAHTDAVIDTFSYDVSDGKGGVATGTLSVKVGYGGTLIRAF